MFTSFLTQRVFSHVFSCFLTGFARWTQSGGWREGCEERGVCPWQHRPWGAAAIYYDWLNWLLRILNSYCKISFYYTYTSYIIIYNTKTHTCKTEYSCILGTHTHRDIEIQRCEAAYGCILYVLFTGTISCRIHHVFALFRSFLRDVSVTAFLPEFNI